MADDKVVLAEARRRWGDTTLLTWDDSFGWRPVFPQDRHNLTAQARRRQRDAFIDWKNTTKAEHDGRRTPDSTRI
jgi:hypothetical protein